MATGDWQPGQYERFKAQRAQPFWDLVALLDVTRPIERAADLGCGTAELTDELGRRLRIADLLGLDNSPNMLTEASARRRPGLEILEADIGVWTDEPSFDLVIANAALHWIPDHATVLERWIAALRPGGQLAVQVPANDDHASHLASATVAEREPFRSAMGGVPPADPVAANVLRPERYSEILYRLGVEDPVVRLQVYPHVFPSTDDVVEWTRGSSLTRFFKALPDDLHEPFVDAYRLELMARVGRHEPYLYTFKRILMWGSVGPGVIPA